MQSVTNELIMLSVITFSVVAPLDWGGSLASILLIDPSIIFLGKAWPHSTPY
jgi:hypothetical protein